MSTYIDRTAAAISTTVVGEATVTVKARKVGKKVVADVTEISHGKPVSATRLQAIVRESVKELLPKPGKPRLIRTSAILTFATQLDDNGIGYDSMIHVGEATFVMGR